MLVDESYSQIVAMWSKGSVSTTDLIKNGERIIALASALYLTHKRIDVQITAPTDHEFNPFVND